MKSQSLENAATQPKRRPAPHPAADAKQFDTAIRGIIKRLRKDTRLSQLVTAKTGSVSQQSVSNIETGRTERLSLSGVHGLAFACGATITILIDDPEGQRILKCSSDQINDPTVFEASVRDALGPLSQKSGRSGAEVSRSLSLSPGTVSKIKTGTIALNLLRLYDFVKACDGDLSAIIHDRHRKVVLECSSAKAADKPASQFNSAARAALQKLQRQRIPALDALPPSSNFQLAELPKKRHLDTGELLDYLNVYGAQVTVSVDDAKGERIKEFSSADLSKTGFNIETRQTLSMLRHRRELSMRDAAQLLNVGPMAVRIMEDVSKDRGLRLSALHRYVTAYDGNITFSIHDNQGNLVAQFSSGKDAARMKAE